MNGGDGPTFDEMPNTRKSGLDIKTGLRVDIRKPMFGSKGGKPKKERNAYTKAFHVSNPFFFEVFAEIKVNNLKPFVKDRILKRIIINKKPIRSKFKG